MRNVRFVEGLIEALPLPDESIDMVLSNCVINLSGDKGAVFREAFRVLRPGGRLAISDVLRAGEPTGPATTGGWCACQDGAEPPERYRPHLREAGFVEAALLRSLAVRSEMRGQGLDVGLVRHVERRAHAAGARTAFALSTTIPRLFERLGISVASRTELPAEVLTSPELNDGCPASAPLFRRPLA